MNSIFFNEEGKFKKPEEVDKDLLMDSVFETLDRNFDAMPEEFIIDDTIYPVSMEEKSVQKLILKSLMDAYIRKEEYIKCERIQQITKKMELNLNL